MSAADTNDERTLLLVDTDHDYLDWATKHLQADGIRILRCDNSNNAIKVCEKTTVDLVISDIALQPMDGIELLGQLKASNPDIIVIITAAFPGTAQIIKASQQGAHDILKKESLVFELRSVVESAWQVIEGRRTAFEHKQQMPDQSGRLQVIGVSRTFQDVFKTVGRVARTDAPVLIYGESGTGKELVANAVHQYSPRRQNEMVALNCGAIPDNLLESELFGHEKGSFTGAAAKRAGRFEQCDGGTLFLDEIGDMPLPVQVKLLRVLQEGTFSRVGGNEVLSSDVRIVAATNKDLAQEVREGRFREDLYYRLNVVELRLPPLRERIEDIPLLAEFFLRKISRKNGLARIRLSGEAITVLQEHKWPGNVRELENTMARAVALATSDVLLANDIPIGVSLRSEAEIDTLIGQLFSLSAENHDINIFDELKRYALKLAKNDKDEAARLLGMKSISENN
ncbi:sigma-54-dependent transcriptional regulator [Rubritalea spongiae]|uniref:DNA-binding transcriptional regulator NtrC n=1 Tax=Rubritalea spongiae TaxID=430797 RepID=A0ABW5E228_9BACT